MYSHYCNGCGRHFESVSMNDTYCSANCYSSNIEYKKQQARYQDGFRSNSDSNSGGYTYGGGQPAIPIELIIFGAAGYVAWDSVKRWSEFEPITSHILLVFHYNFYKPLHFSTNIYSYLTRVDRIHDLGVWFFFLKWFAIIFYVIFIFCLYITIIDALNKKGLTWLWVLFLISPIITHGIWYFFIK